MPCRLTAWLRKVAPLQHNMSVRQHTRRVHFISLVILLSWLAHVAISFVRMKVALQQGTSSFVKGALYMDRFRAIGYRVPVRASKSVPDDTGTAPSFVQDAPGTVNAFKLSESTNIGNLGYVLAKCAQNGTLETLYAEGKGISASAIAIKSVVVANTLLPATTSSSHATGPKQIVILPSTVVVMQQDTEDRIRRFQFQLAVVGNRPSEVAAEGSLKVSKTTHFGRLATAMLRCIEADGEAVLTSVGDRALSNSLVATLIAQRVTDENEANIGRLALLPTWYNASGTKRRKGMQLRCFKI